MRRVRAAMSLMAPDRFSISVSRDGCRSTLSRSKRSAAISPITLIKGAAISRCASQADNRPASTNQYNKTDQRLRIVIRTGPKIPVRHHRHQRPARERNRRQHGLIGLSFPYHLAMKRFAIAGL